MFDGMRKNSVSEMTGLYFKMNRFLGEDFRNPCEYVTMMECVKCDLGEIEEKIRAGVQKFLLNNQYRLGVCNDEDKEHFFTHMCMERIGYVLFKETLADTELMRETYYKMKIKHSGINVSDCVSLDTLLGCTIDEIEKEITEKLKIRCGCMVADGYVLNMLKTAFFNTIECDFYNKKMSFRKKTKEELSKEECDEMERINVDIESVD